MPAAEYFPERHGVHDVAPAEGENWPAGHEVHDVEPAVTEYFPAGHEVHGGEPVVEYEPAGHVVVVQEVEPSEEDPVVHLLQTDELAEEE